MSMRRERHGHECPSYSLSLPPSRGRGDDDGGGRASLTRLPKPTRQHPHHAPEYLEYGTSSGRTMRTAFDLDLATLDTCLMLIHGAYACGKTHLQGDFLTWAQGRGEVAFLNVKGEDGYASIAAAGLWKVGETVDSVDAY